MSAGNNSIWEGFESEFFGGVGGESLSETTPVSHMESTLAENRQILLILFVIDVSGSMRGQRIAQVNYALENIFKELRRRDDANARIKIGIMEFCDEAEWVTQQPVPLEDYIFTRIDAQPWITNYGKAFDKLREVLHRSKFMNPSLGEYFAPLIMFITDGEPVDVNEYPAALARLNNNGWFNKSAKYAIAVGEEAKNDQIGALLSSFTGVRENVRFADEGEALCDLIEFIAIRASEVQSSMISRRDDDGSLQGSGAPSIFNNQDPNLFSSMFNED